MRAAVFLDRDGVLAEPVIIDRRPYPAKNPNELVVGAATVEACRQLRAASLMLVMVTNQPDIARGTQTRVMVDAINLAVGRRIALDAIYICPHDDADGCSCRKPQPGMLLEAVQSLNIDLGRSVMIGDRWRDIEAGHRAGCATVFIDRGYDEPQGPRADLTVLALPDAVQWIIARARSTKRMRS